ncbi:MAG: hypothetical protein WCL08_09675, partial [Verrucomicrobiota bacterium]
DSGNIYAEPLPVVFHGKDSVRLDKNVSGAAVPARDKTFGLGAELVHGVADHFRTLSEARSYSVVPNVLADKVTVCVDEVVAQFMNTLYTRVEPADPEVWQAFLGWWQAEPDACVELKCCGVHVHTVGAKFGAWPG